MSALVQRIVWHFGAYRVTDEMLDGMALAIREEAAG